MGLLYSLFSDRTYERKRIFYWLKQINSQAAWSRILGAYKA
ncbi:Imm71 family immunity protein [Ralstonia solanacearum]|nr:Imm71 family immunity protein [Ralstonia solanacearum]